MPWFTRDDVRQHNQRAARDSKAWKTWLRVANRIYALEGEAGAAKAITIANFVVKKMLDKKGKRKDKKAKTKDAKKKRSKKRPKANPPPIPYGECFSWAFREQARFHKKDIPVILVHAKIVDPWDKHLFWHAWIERDGKVYDWQTAVVFKRPARTIKEFREIYQPKNEKRYSRLAAIRAAVKFESLGPWK